MISYSNEKNKSLIFNCLSTVTLKEWAVTNLHSFVITI